MNNLWQRRQADFQSPMHREREEFESRPLHYLLLFLLFSSRERLWLPDSEGRSQRGGVGFHEHSVNSRMLYR